MKGIHFSDLRDAGDPADWPRPIAGRRGRIILLVRHKPALTLLELSASPLNIFCSVHGWRRIRSLDDAGAVFDAGADKVAITRPLDVRPCSPA